MYFCSGSVSFICFTIEAEDKNFFSPLLTDYCTQEQLRMPRWHFSWSPLNKSIYEILCSYEGWPSIDRPPRYPKPFSCRFAIFTHVFHGLPQSLQQIMGYHLKAGCPRQFTCYPTVRPRTSKTAYLHKYCQPTNQPSNERTNQPTNQTNQPTNQTTNQLIN